jgi:alpha-amylase/alpha-mannosidase (GH57 family)
MKDAYITIHGHFYQPPRENPWLEAIEVEASASPFHDWNERITFECYRPNAYARMVDGKGKILDLLNNYSSISFNVGPTLLSWLQEKFPKVYQKILDADRESIRRFGHGNAMAQAYNHIIMPLANEKDQETEVLWGMADFERRFRRKPDAMWLPETAVNYPTLKILVKYGMQFLILSPFQALKVRPLGGKKWTDVSQGRIDPTQPYRCFVKDPSGRKLSDQFIDLFFYDGVISKEVAFGNLLTDGKAFCERFAHAYDPLKKSPQLINIATDGETYGHHKKFGEMALAYALKEGISSQGFEVINYGAFLKRFPPVYEVEIDEGPKGEGTSWSCAHGVGRWKEDCGCSTGGRAGWNQRWRKPLREALDLLRDELDTIFEREGEKIFKDIREARNGYIDVILDRSSESLNRFFDRYEVEGLNPEGRFKGLKLLEMERHALLMYTSCGWFFADLAGLEAVQVLLYAGRAIQLAEEFCGQEIEEKFIQRLSEARSNLPEMGDGRGVYEKLVKPRFVTFEKLVNHYAVSTLFDGVVKERKIFSYRMEKIDYEKVEQGGLMLVLGRVRVTSQIIPEPKIFVFGLMGSAQGLFRTWISEDRRELHFTEVKEKFAEGLAKGGEEIVKLLTFFLGNHIFTIRDILKEETQTIFQNMIQEELKEHRRIYAELFDKSEKTIGTLIREGFEIPYEIRVAAEVTLSDRLLHEAKDLRRDFKGTLERGEIDKMIEEAREYGLQLKTEEPTLILSGLLKDKMENLQEAMARYQPGLSGEDKVTREKVEEVIRLLDLAGKWGFKCRKEEAQHVMDEMLKEYVWGLEKSWWGEAVERPFPSNLILLADKLDFNVEKFTKVIHPAIST